MQPPSPRFRALLTGTTALVLATSLAACSGGDGGRGDAAKDAGTTTGPAAAGTASAAPAAPAAGSKVAMPTGPTTTFGKARDTTAGPITVTTLTGAKSGVSGKVWVWLPPEYNDPKYARTGFPVIVLFSGGQSAGYNTYTDNQLPIQAADVEMTKAGTAHPFIMIMPVQNLDPDEHKALECSDIPGQPKMGTWLAEDIPAFIRANFRTLKSRDGWGVMGASTGAFCSAKLALQHPETFGVAVPVDGYWAPDSPLWKGHEAERQANSPNAMVSQGKADVRMLATAAGGTAPEVKLVKDWVAKAVPPLKIDYYEQPGGQHLTSDFKKMIPNTLEWLTKNMAGPTAD
ncbi:esterase family protein [Kitasatospora sp. NBC_00085]|uniref:alpha/beta hydrolase n=1 Tax=unclassified Kitasatospora TaxID=2633591 RepID=UPI00324FB4DC